MLSFVEILVHFVEKNRRFLGRRRAKLIAHTQRTPALSCDVVTTQTAYSWRFRLTQRTETATVLPFLQTAKFIRG